MTKKKLFLFLFLFLFSFFLYNCTEKTEPNLLTTSINTTNVGDTNTPDAGDTNPSSTPVKRVLPHITNERVVTAVDTNTVPLGEGMFYLQLTHALDNQSSDETTYANAIALIRAALRAGNGQIEIETTRAKQDITQGSNLLQTIPYSKTTYRLLKNGVRTLLIDYPYSRGKTISHGGLAMDFFDEYYLQSITFKRGVADHVHYSSLNVINTLTAYTSIPLAIQNGINGNIRLGYQGNFSMWGAIQAGRLAIIAGDVREQVAISDEQIQSLPVIFSNYSISIQFYSEDWTDFDYNDSFVRVELTRQIDSSDDLSIVPNQVFTVSEGVETNTFIGVITVYSENPIDNIIIIDGDTSGRFIVYGHENQGTLYTSGEIDYDHQANYQLAIEITDNQNNVSTGIVYVNVDRVDLTNIGGITYVLDNERPMSFYSNGQVSNGVLITNTSIDEVIYYGSTELVFYSNGRVGLGVLTDAYTNNEGTVFEGLISFYDNGDISDGYLLGDQMINNVMYSENREISFYPNGNVRFGMLSGSQNIDGLMYSSDSRYFTIYHPNGRVFASLLTTNTIINGVNYRGNGNDIRIVFYSNGQIQSGLLARDTYFYNNQIQLASNTYVTFYDDGGLMSGQLVGTNSFSLANNGGIGYYFGLFDLFPGGDKIGDLRQIRLSQNATLWGVNYNVSTYIRFNEYVTAIESYSDYYEGFGFTHRPEEVFEQSIFSKLPNSGNTNYK